MIEKEEKNTLRRTAAITGREASDERSPSAGGALRSQFRERDLLPYRGERAIHLEK